MKNFWSTTELFSTRKLIVMSFFTALTVFIASTPLNFYLMPGIRLFSFTYLPSSVIAASYGPIAGMIVGALGDIISYFINPSGGPFHFGFTISAMVSSLVYSLFLYRPQQHSRPRIVNIIMAQIVVLVIVSLGLNMYWLKRLYGWTAGELYNWLRIAPKIIQFPVDTILIKISIKIFHRLKNTNQ